MKFEFVKMQGIGNDYVFVDTKKNNLPNDANFLGDLSRKISDRHFGIGSDGLILICRGENAEFKMRMFNVDGSESEMCGNGLRCFAKFIYDRGLVKEQKCNVETGAGLREVMIFADEKNIAKLVQIKMGIPKFKNADIPVRNSHSEDTLKYPYEILVDNKSVRLELNCVSVGNPHCVIFLKPEDNLSTYQVKKYGRLIENDMKLFPNKVNIEFAKIESRDKCFQRTWERGSGETLGCGTGATALFAVGRKLGFFDEKITISLLGGDLELYEDKDFGEILLKGAAEEVFVGTYTI